MINLIKLVVCLVFLLYSCRCDLKTRTVRNELWGVVFVATLPLVIMCALTHGSRYLLHTTVSVVIIFVLVYILFRLGVFGGADAKALIAISFVIPAFPVMYGLPLSGTPYIDVFALSVLMNAVLLTTVVPLGILVYNLCTLSMREIMENTRYLVVGYKCRVVDLGSRHVEPIDGCGLAGEFVWVTPGIPFMLPITSGFISAVVYGDIMTTMLITLP